MKRCKNCLHFKPLDDFHGHRDTADRKMPYCKDCQNEIRRANRMANLERERLYEKARWKLPHRTEAKLDWQRVRRFMRSKAKKRIDGASP